MRYTPTAIIGVFAAAGLGVAPAADPPIRPATVRLDRPGATLAAVVADIERQTGLKVDLAAADGSVPCPVAAGGPFWDVLQQIADQTGHRITVGRQGRHISLVKRAGPPPIAGVDRAFRVVATGVTARADYETGRTIYDVWLELHWEPRFPVFRVDAQPKVTRAVDDLGTPLSVPAVGVKSPVSGYSHATAVRVEGLTRKAAKIVTLAGSFTVTASPKMLTFTFDDLSAPLPVEKEQDGVKVAMTKFARRDGRWEAELRLDYPPGHPEFESFESWASGNAIKLIAPGRTKSSAEETFDLTGSGRSVVATYRFPASAGPGADRQGWMLVYETPAPLVEFPVRFELKDLPLP